MILIRRIIALTMVLGILFNSLDKLLIITSYEVNKTYIAQNLCENRTKPCKHCNGKCYMRKRMQENEKKESVPAGNNLKEKFQQELFCQSLGIDLTNTVADFNYPLYTRFIPSANYGLGVFHPPTV